MVPMMIFEEGPPTTRQDEGRGGGGGYFVNGWHGCWILIWWHSTNANEIRHSHRIPKSSIELVSLSSPTSHIHLRNTNLKGIKMCVGT